MFSLTLAESPRGPAAARIFRPRIDHSLSRRDRGAEPAAQRLHHRHPRSGAAPGRCRRRGAGRGRGRQPHRHSAGDQGPVLHRRRAHHRWQPHPWPLRAALREHGDGESAARRGGVPRQDQPRRVRHGLVQHDLGLRAGGQSLDAARQQRRRWCRAARRAARRRRWRRGWRWGRPAPTPAARSASPPASAASPASSRPTGGAAAGASSPSPPRSTRPARWRARSRTAPSCSARWPGTTRRIPPAPTVAVPDFAAACRRGVKGLRIGVPREYRSDDMPAGDRGAVAAGPALAARRRRGDRRRLAAAHEIRRWPPTTSSLPPRPRPTSRAMTACASARAPRASTSTRCTRTPAPPASAPR